MCVLLLKLSVLYVYGISIEVGNKRKGNLRMNTLVEPKFCILEKSWIVCSPASLQAKKVLQIQFMCLWLYGMRWNSKVETCVGCWFEELP